MLTTLCIIFTYLSVTTFIFVSLACLGLQLSCRDTYARIFYLVYYLSCCGATKTRLMSPSSWFDIWCETLFFFDLPASAFPQHFPRS